MEGDLDLIGTNYAHAKQPAKIVLVPDRAMIKADGVDLSFVTVKVVDKMEHLCRRLITS